MNNDSMKNIEKRKRLIRRFLHNLYTKDEAEEFLQYVNERGNDSLMDDIASDLEEESRLKGVTDTLTYNQYKEEAKGLLQVMENKQKPGLYRTLLSIAAVASILFISIYLLDYLKNNETHSTLYTENVTFHGEKKRLIFSDSTRVMLNSRTSIMYPENFGETERHVKLSGEAYFDVSKNETPFIVETTRFTIHVLGTSFNVKAYDEDEAVSIAVNEGRVQVRMSDASFVLKPSEKIVLNTLTGEFKKEVNTEDRHSFAWTNGWLHFDRTPVRDVARELERIYGCTILFNEGEEFDNLISGEHDNQSLEAVLQSIEYTSEIKYLIEENEVLLYK